MVFLRSDSKVLFYPFATVRTIYIWACCKYRNACNNDERYSSNSEADASELLKNLKEMFTR